MTPHIVTASSIARALVCMASVFLDRVASRSRAQGLGTAIHEFLKNVAAIGRGYALAAVPLEFRAHCEALDLSRLPVEPDRWAHEVAFSYHPIADSSVELWRGATHRDYVHSGDPELVYGTIDVVGLSPDTAHVIDYKSGGQFFETAATEAMKTYGLMAARAYGKRRAVLTLLIVEPGEHPRSVTHPMEAADLDAWQAELARFWVLKMAAERGDVRAQPTEGEHCYRCQSLPFCPAKARLAVAMGDGTFADALPTLALSVETVPKLLRQLALYDQVADSVREAIKGFARLSPVPLPDGKVYGEVNEPKWSIDAPGARPILTELYGADVAAAAVRETVTQEGLGDAVRLAKARIPGSTLSGLKRTALEALEAAGVARRVPDVKVKSHKPKHEEIET